MPSAEAPPAAAGEAAKEAFERRREEFFARRGWQPFAYQRRAWEAFAAGESGLIHVPTGAGKTYAAFLGPLAALAAELAAGGGAGKGGEKAGGKAGARKAGTGSRGAGARGAGLGLRVVYVTPLRATGHDVEAALALAVDELGLPFAVESRTGDTPQTLRRKQRQRLPEVLVTTPESLSLLLADEGAPGRFAGLRAAIVDEWHELLATKRGTQVELALARLRRLAPGLATWALSATLANLEEAARAAVGVAAPEPTVVTAELARPVVLDAVLPAVPGRIPWAGHLGLTMLDDVLARLDPARPTLVFTNTRSQCERWFDAIRSARPRWAKRLGIHHGSLDRGERQRVEEGLKEGEVTIVVCTASLDLGVDFPPVERVFQVGSPKGVARLLQRAGRSGHRPGETAHLVCVPTHALELVEIAAVREAIARGAVEERAPLAKPLDVLAQHLVTRALGGGFERGEILAEVRDAWSYRDLGGDELDWTLALVEAGGGTLAAYPEYHKVVRGDDGRYHVADRRVARLHRMNVGTITADAAMELRYLSGRRLGTVEESFIARHAPGERFLFAGRVLELVRVRDFTAYVRRTGGRAAATPRWLGGRMPISPALSAAVRRALGRVDRALGEVGETAAAAGVDAASADAVAGGRFADEPELAAALPVLAAQARLSRLPQPGQLLAETCRTREGHHLFLFPFDGRLVHEGLAALLALRASRHPAAAGAAATFTLAASDYGVELLTPGPFPWREVLGPDLFSTARLAADAVDSVNLSELARRQFREVARIAGLVFESRPGGRKTARQVQASASLLYDVFSRFEPDNLLLAQARREVMERHFESGRLAACLERLAAAELLVVDTRRPTPLAFPLVVERLSARLSAESLLDRVERMKRAWTRDLGAAVR